MSSKQLFILGAPRSGTTFLASVLSDSPFGVPIETHFITKYYKKIASYGDLSKRENFRHLVSDILSERAVRQWGLELNLDRFFEELAPEYSYANIVDALMSRFRLGDPGAAWGDKTPHYLGDAEILLELFPDAKFVHIVRDGRDVALSLLQKPWGPNNIVSCAEYWRRLNSKEKELQEIRKTAGLYSLSYEELLENPLEMTQRLYGFLGEQLPATQLSQLTKHTKTDNKEKWRTEMNPKQLRRFEAIAGGKLKELGYSLSMSNPKISSAEIIFFHLHEVISRWIFLFHTNVIEGFMIRFFGKQPFSD